MTISDGANHEAYSHAHLVAAAAKWLRRQCVVIVTELSVSGLEEPDAFGWRYDGTGVLVECKASRSDFFADRKKQSRRFPDLCPGAERYYFTPRGLVSGDVVPEGWGLLELNGARVLITKRGERFAENNAKLEKVMLLSLLRRLGVDKAAGVSMKCYSFNLYETKSRATLGLSADDVNNCDSCYNDLAGRIQ